MGKPRKIVIDDRIPFCKKGGNLFPRSENSDDLWPSIITKALIKLFSYKFRSIQYYTHEIGDLQIIYALTGYIPENINFDKLIESNEFCSNNDEEALKKNQNSSCNKIMKVQEIIKTKLTFYLGDENFFYKKNFVMIYNHIKVTDVFNLSNPIFNYSSIEKNKLTNSNDGKQIVRTKTPKFFSKSN